MNAYTKFTDISMQALPDPLTQVDQTSFPWLKLPHTDCLVDPDVSVLSLEAQGVLFRLICHSGRQYPYASLPNDMRHLINMAGFKLPPKDSPAYLKKLAKAEGIVRSVLDATFIYCRDERYYCTLLIDVLSDSNSQPVPTFVSPDNASHASASTGQDPTPSPQGRKRTANAERVARFRANKKAVDSGVTPNVTPENVTGNAAVTPDVMPTVTDVMPVTPAVTSVTGNSVTNEGGKGGDLDLNPDLDLDSASKKNKTNPDDAGQQAHEPDYFQTPGLGWTPRLDLLNARLKMAGHKPVTQEVLLQTLVTFNPHYDDQPAMSDNNRTGKLVNWIGDKQQKAARQPYKQSVSKPNPNTTYYGISKDDVQKYARAGETEFDCAQRLASERSNPPDASNPPDKKPAAVWSIGDKSTLKQIQRLDTSITPERIDAMAKQQGKDRDVVMASLYHTLATEQKKQDIAAAQAKAGQQ